MFISILKDFVSKKKEDRKILFRDFLEPAIQDLNITHQNYIETFLKYINSIETQNTTDLLKHPVLKDIIADSISSSNLREKLYSFYDNTNDELLKNFVDAISKILWIFIGVFY